MKFRMIALAALAATGSAHALSPADIVTARGNGTLKEVYIAGASAQRLFIGAWVQEQCKPATFDVFFNGTGAAPSGSSHRAYSCELNKKVGNWVAGTKLLVVKRDAGGSTQGVNPVATATAQDVMLVDASCTATGQPSPSADILVPSYACNSVTSKVVDAGVSDVEPAVFQRDVNLLAPAVKVDTTTLDSAAFNQTIMAPAVNKTLYAALQAAQGLAQDDAPANQPSLPSTFLSAVFSGKIAGGGTKKMGWNVVIPSSVDANVLNKQVNVCRRNIGSGTQAAFNIQFLNAGCVSTVERLLPVGQTVTVNTNSANAVSPAIAQVGTLAWVNNSGSGTVESCLGTTVEGVGGYGIGILSRENTPTPTGTTTDKGYRFVKVDGIAPTRDNAKVGRYDMVYAATMQWNKNTLVDADKLAFAKALRTNGAKATSLNVADVDTQQGVLAPPTTYTTAYADITDATTLKFASRVDRLKANSCSPLAVVK